MLDKEGFIMFTKNIFHEAFHSIFDIPLQVTYWDGDTRNYHMELGNHPIHITIKKALPLSELTSHLSLTLGEAYMNGDIEIDGDGSIQAIVNSAFRHINKIPIHFPQKVQKFSHSKKESQNDIHSHYDIGNDFYKLWLDKNLVYSCAYFEEDNHDDLDRAQIDKIHHILDKLHPQKGKTLLDIGCGWGDILFIGAKEYGLKTTGVTLSEEQYHYVQQKIKAEHLENQVTVLLEDYRDIHGTFDYITSVGMFEHVGKKNLGEYIHDVKDLLADDGYALIHGITSQHRSSGVDPFIVKYIFPGGYIPNIEEMIGHIVDAHLQLTDLECLRRHYQRTLEIWDKNFNQHRDEVRQMFDEHFVRMWDLYLQACAGSFESGNIDVMQFLLTKQPSGTNLPMTRAYMTKE